MPTVSSIMRAHIREELPPLQELNPEVPEALVKVVKRMAAKDPNDRYPTCEVLFEELENVKLRQRYEHDAMVDGLTGVFNRRWLDEKLPRFVRRYRVGQQPLGLLLLDIDHFKRFNDDHGHAAGDRVLKVVADEMGNRLRPDDFRARYGGEEFVVILPNSDLAGSVSAAQRLRHAVKKLRVEGEDGKVLPPITVSIGAAVLAPTESAEALLARADAALYRAKDGGRDAVIVAKDEPVEATG